MLDRKNPYATEFGEISVRRCSLPFLSKEKENLLQAWEFQAATFPFSYQPNWTRVQKKFFHRLKPGDALSVQMVGEDKMRLLVLPTTTIEHYQESLQQVLYCLEMNVWIEERTLEGQDALAESFVVLQQHPCLKKGYEGVKSIQQKWMSFFYKEGKREKSQHTIEEWHKLIVTDKDGDYLAAKELIAFLSAHAPEYSQSSLKIAVDSWIALKEQLEVILLSFR